MFKTEAEQLEKLKEYGVGRRSYDDPMFADDRPPPRYGIYDEDEENLCHNVIKTTCHIPGCQFTGESLLDYENHYNSAHRHSCSQCKKSLPSAHLLDLHLQETHDSFFAAMASRKPSYCCYIEECTDKFVNAEERREHCVSEHKLPKDFRFDLPSRAKNKKKAKNTGKISEKMEIEESDPKKMFQLTNSKSKAFPKYSGKKFTKTNKNKQSNTNVNIDQVMEDLKGSLPD